MPFRTALSGLNAASSDLRVTGNNIANAGTTGFKESRPSSPTCSRWRTPVSAAMRWAPG
jgi:flagellar hook protein FlgE